MVSGKLTPQSKQTMNRFKLHLQLLHSSLELFNPVLKNCNQKGMAIGLVPSVFGIMGPGACSRKCVTAWKGSMQNTICVT